MKILACPGLHVYLLPLILHTDLQHHLNSGQYIVIDETSNEGN